MMSAFMAELNMGHISFANFTQGLDNPKFLLH